MIVVIFILATEGAMSQRSPECKKGRSMTGLLGFDLQA
jgi:hypothetical protein